MGKRSHKSDEKSEKEVKKIKLDDGKKVSKRKHRHKEKHKKKHKKEKRRKIKASKTVETAGDADDSILNDRLLSDRAKAMAPVTKEEWEKRQSVIRKVVDEETGRTRLVKGDGEILEEIVSKQEHLRINKMATKSDGQYFQKNMISKLK